MGGSSSGRWGGRPTVEISITLSLPDLFRQGLWRANDHKGGTLVFRDGYTEDVVGSLKFQANLGTESGRVHIEHGSSSYWLHLVTTLQPFRGRRWWIICPLTGERILKLHKPGALANSRPEKLTGLDIIRSGRAQRIAPSHNRSRYPIGMKTAMDGSLSRNGCDGRHL